MKEQNVIPLILEIIFFTFLKVCNRCKKKLQIYHILTRSDIVVELSIKKASVLMIIKVKLNNNLFINYEVTIQTHRTGNTVITTYLYI